MSFEELDLVDLAFLKDMSCYPLTMLIDVRLLLRLLLIFFQFNSMSCASDQFGLFLRQKPPAHLALEKARFL